MTEQLLKGQLAVVTGSARNIGRETALMLADDGADVVVCAKSDRDAADAVAKEVEARGRKSMVHVGDLTDPAVAEALIEQAHDTFGRIDILVCNSAIRRQHPLHEISIEEWHEVIDVDLHAPFYLIRRALPIMMEQGYGRIVTIGGSTLHLLTPNRAHVTAAKLGLLGLTRAVAIEYGEAGITANCVAPGHVDTVRGASAGQRSSGGLTRPIERMGTMAEIAAMVRHLCRPEGAYITGQCLHVNGGMYMGGA